MKISIPGRRRGYVTQGQMNKAIDTALTTAAANAKVAIAPVATEVATVQGGEAALAVRVTTLEGEYTSLAERVTILEGLIS